MDHGKNTSLGDAGEAFASRFLKGRGYRILERNFLARGGEIDIVALEGGTLCFVEVKTRRSEAAGTAEEAVNRDKIRKIVNASLEYRRRHGLTDTPVRFDIVAVKSAGEERFDAELTKGAFYEDGWG
jgi:putative endonuclease